MKIHWKSAGLISDTQTVKPLTWNLREFRQLLFALQLRQAHGCNQQNVPKQNAKIGTEIKALHFLNMQMTPPPTCTHAHTHRYMNVYNRK
jgi:hypothetical protein